MEETKVLIVEDEVVVARDLRNVLESRRYAVLAAASSGEVAIQRAAELRPDLVLMDILLKGDMDGIEAAAQIRARFDIPVIFVTAYGDEKMLRRARVTEPFGYILKPFDERELHINIQMALYKHEMERKLRESEEQFRTVADFTCDWEYWETPDGTLRYISPACERITGYTANQFIADPFLLQEIVLPEDKKIWTQHRHQVAEAAMLREIQFRIRQRDGETCWIEHACQPVTDEEGAFLGYRVSNRDITERKRVEKALQRRNHELALLNRVGRTLVSTLDLDQLLVIVLEEVRRLLDVTACSVWLTDPETGGLVCLQSTGPQNEIVRGWRLAPGRGICGWVARHGESLIVPDAWADGRYFKEVDEQTGLGLRSILTMPLRVKDSVIGALQVLDTEVDCFSTADLELLGPLVASAAIAIENARLYGQARRDAETKSTLLREINHRVKNNLTAIIGLLYAARNHAKVEDWATYQSVMNDLIGRVRGLAAVHNMLSVSGWTPLQLSDLAGKVVRASSQAFPRDKRVSIDVPPSPVRVTPDEAHHLALVLNELAINALKYALGERDTVHITFHIALDDSATARTVRCEFRDDGPGYPEDVLRLERHSVGFDLIQNIVRSNLRGELSLHNDDGAVVIIQFKTGAGIRGENGK